MASANLYVTGSAGDAHEYTTGAFHSTNTAVQIITRGVGGARSSGGLHFRKSPIPKGSTITAAYPQLYVISTVNDYTFFDIYGNDVDSAEDFEDDPSIFARDNTTATVALNQNGVGVGYFGSGVDLTAIFQEIIDRAGYALQNNLALLLRHRTQAIAKHFYFYSFDFGSFPPFVHIEWTPPAYPSLKGATLKIPNLETVLAVQNKEVALSIRE